MEAVLKVFALLPMSVLMASQIVSTALYELCVATERVELARGAEETSEAIAYRESAVQRVATIIGSDEQAFSASDIALLRDLHGRGNAVLAGLVAARRRFCAETAELQGMRRIFTSFVPQA